MENTDYQDIKSDLQILKKELQEIKNLTLLGVKQVVTMEEAALLTGLSVPYLYQLSSAKKVPYHKRQGGNKNYFDKDELYRWLLENRMKSASELETEAANIVVTGKRKGVAL